METMPADIAWGVIVIMLPLAGGIICFLWPMIAKTLGLVTVTGVALSVAGLGWQITQNGAYHHTVGGWGAPLGIDLFADGLSLLMLIMTALVGLGISFYSKNYLSIETGLTMLLIV